jgi:hypothetical protein
MNQLLQELDSVIQEYAPELYSKFDKGLPEKRIIRYLNKSKVIGNIAPLLELYSWKNGISPDYTDHVNDSGYTMSRRSFYPKDVCYLRDLSFTCVSFEAWEEYAENRPAMKEAIGRYFPILMAERGGLFCIDLDQSQKGRIVYIHISDSRKPFLELYSSFDDFIRDTIATYKENRKLQCFPPDWIHPYDLEEDGDDDDDGEEDNNDNKKVVVVGQEVKKNVNHVHQTPVSKDLLIKLEEALISRESNFEKLLQPGLSAGIVRDKLHEAGFNGNVEALVELYTWKNGTFPEKKMTLGQTSILPDDIYQFIDIDTAMEQQKMILDIPIILEAHPLLAENPQRYFPFLWDTVTGYMVLDTALEGNQGILHMEIESPELFDKAYESFESFLKEVIEENIEAIEDV